MSEVRNSEVQFRYCDWFAPIMSSYHVEDIDFVIINNLPRFIASVDLVFAVYFHKLCVRYFP